MAGLVDPDPRVSGKGLEFLRSKQIEICLMDDMEANACLAANLPFIHRVLHQTPFCTLLLDPSSSLLKCKDCNNLADAVGSMDTFITSISYLRGLTPNSDSCADIGRRLVDLLPDYLTIYIVYEAADAQEKLLSQEVVEILISCGRAAHHISVSMEEVIVALAENGTCNGVVVCSNEMATATKQGFQRLLEVSGQNASVIVTNCWNPTV